MSKNFYATRCTFTLSFFYFLPSGTSQWDNRTAKPDIKHHNKGRLLNLLKISSALTDIASNEFLMDMLSGCSGLNEVRSRDFCDAGALSTKL